MSYQFNPKTEEELEAGELVEDGLYNFEVTRSTRKHSAAGNAMAALQLLIWDKAGKAHVIFDFLVFSDVNMCIRKVKHFCDTTGLQESYKNGNIAEDLSGYSGKCWIVTQDEQPNPKGGVYPKKNIVDDYESEKQAKKDGTGEPFVDSNLDDDLPF